MNAGISPVLEVLVYFHCVPSIQKSGETIQPAFFITLILLTILEA